MAFSGNQYHCNPTPIINGNYVGNNFTPISASNPLAVSNTPTAAISATQNTITVDTTAGGVTLKAAGTGLKGVLLVNNGATDCYGSLSGTAVSGATAVANGGFLLKAGGGALYMDNPGPLVIKGIVAAGSTIVAVSLVS